VYTVVSYIAVRTEECTCVISHNRAVKVSNIYRIFAYRIYAESDCLGNVGAIIEIDYD
jgi:hypothetical protein